MLQIAYEFDFEGTISCEDGNKSLKLSYRLLKDHNKMVRAEYKRFYRGDEKILDYLGMVPAKRANLSHGTLLRQDGSKEYEGHFHAESKIVMPRYNEYSR